MKHWIETFPRLALTIVAVFCLLPGTWVLPLMDRDEPRFSRATVEMNERGSWAVPYFNNEYRFDKPPLTYWCMEPGLALFGKSEMAVRLHSVLCSWLIALVLFEMAVLLGAGKGQAFFAGAGWLTCLQVILHGRTAVADVLLILWIVTAMYCLLKIGRRAGQKRVVLDRWFWGLVGSLALGFLAKGPLAFLVPGLAMALGWLALWRAKQAAGPLGRAALNLGVALIPAMALVALWGIPALKLTNGAYFDVGIGKHVVERGTMSFNKRKSVPGLYYLVVMIPFLLPWTALLPRALADAWRKLNWERALMLGWFAAPFLIFGFYATQLPHYILPGYPGLMVLIALMVGAPVLGQNRAARWWRGIAVGLPFLLGSVALAGGLFALSRLEDKSLPTAIAGIGALFLLLGLASRSISGGRPLVGVVFAMAGGALMWPVSQAARNAHLTVRLLAAIGQPSPGELRSWGFGEPTLVWYFQRPWTFSDNGDGLPMTVVRTRRWRLDEKTLAALWKGEPASPVDDYTAEALQKLPPGIPRYVQGWSPGSSSWLELAYVKEEEK